MITTSVSGNVGTISIATSTNQLYLLTVSWIYFEQAYKVQNKGLSYGSVFTLTTLTPASYSLASSFVLPSDLDGNCVVGLIEMDYFGISPIQFNSNPTTNVYWGNAVSPYAETLSLVCFGACQPSYAKTSSANCQFCNVTLLNCFLCSSMSVCTQCVSPFLLNTVTHKCIATNPFLANCV